LIGFLWAFTAWTERMRRLQLFFLFRIILINFPHELTLIAYIFIIRFVPIYILNHLAYFSNWKPALTIEIRITGIIINNDDLLITIIAERISWFTTFQIWQLDNLLFILIRFIIPVHLSFYVFKLRCIFFTFIELERAWAQLLLYQLTVIALRRKLFVMQ